MKHNKASIKNKKAAKPQQPYSQKNLTLLYLLVIVVAGLIAYANSFDGAFVFDDRPNILNNAHLINFRGLVYANNGKINEAQKDFEKALEIDPAYQDAKNMLDKLKAK